LAGLAVIGPLNLSVSFYLAFRLALASQGISGVNRHRIRQAIGQRIRAQPLTFSGHLKPPRHQRFESAGSSASAADAEAAKALSSSRKRANSAR
jgi:site-specific recombinase